MPEDQQQSKFSFLSGGDSVKMPEDPQQPKYGLLPSGDPLAGFVFSRQKRLQALERFQMKKRMRVISECSDHFDLSDHDDVPPPSDSTPPTAASAPPPTDKLIVDEMDEDEEDEEDDDEMAYPCPYCYVEFELIPLIHHLEHEHYDETAETVCTICADKISGDMLRHITTEHEPLFRLGIQQNRSRKIPNPRMELSLSGRDLREAHLKTLLAGKGQQSSSGVSDPMLSSLVLNYPAPVAEEFSKLVISCAEDSSKKVEPAQHMWQSSFDPSLSSEEREERTRQAAGKAAFVQDLVCSTMFLD